MEGKTIVKVQNLNQGYQVLKLDDDSVVLVKVVGELDIEALSGDAKPAKGKDKPAAKEDKAPKAKEKAPKEKPKAKKLTGEEIQAMDEEELTALIEEKELDVDPADFEDDLEGLQGAVAEELDIELPEAEAAEVGYTWEDLEAMDEDELKELISENNLDTDPDDHEDDEDALRAAIAKEIGVEVPKKSKKGKK